MNSLLKIPYEISLWDDRLTYVDGDGNEYDDFAKVPEGDVNTVQYYKEKKLCVIGSSTMEAPFRAIEPNLVRKTDGTSTLTFSIYARYYDEEAGEFKPNPFIKYLNNERKVKLKYYPNGELRWLDFIIKKIDESNENYQFKYTATDLFINELSKTGYSLVFDTELENNQGTVQKLAEDILVPTDWMVGDDSEIIQQLKAEPLYEITLDEDLQCLDIFTNNIKHIESGEKIYAFYSSVTNTDKSYFQFIYNDDGKYTADENNIIHTAGNYYCLDEPVGKKELFHGFKGEKYIRTHESAYDKVLQRYVKKYQKNGQDYLGYSETEYFTPSLVTNYITNGQHITSRAGWEQIAPGYVEVDLQPPYTETVKEGKTRRFGLILDQTNGSNQLLNSGFRDNAELIKEITTNDTFVFRGKASALSGSETAQYARLLVAKYTKNSNGDIEIVEGKTLISAEVDTFVLDDEEFFCITDLKPNYAVSYEELTDTISTERFGIFLQALTPNREVAKGRYFVEGAELFKQYYGSAMGDNKNQLGIILPSGNILYEGGSISEQIATSYTKTTYYYYKADATVNLSSADELEYEYIGEEEPEYKPVYDLNFEKTRSISKKESNRFDLLQTLSETFECWCRFDVWHRETGEIILGRDLNDLLINAGTADSKEKVVFLGGTSYSKDEVLTISGNESFDYGDYQQIKFVTFHKRIGQKKNIGFKYGMNLKSIFRNLDSGDIATKLIVKSNTNEFADGGSCNIALSRENPSGENFVYDFSHYIRQGMLNEDNLNNDLYYNGSDNRGWIGLYPKLKAQNQLRDTLILEWNSCLTRRNHLKSDQVNAELLYSASTDELEDYRNKYYEVTGHEYEGALNGGVVETTEIQKIVFEIERLSSELKQLEEGKDGAKAQLRSLEERIDELEEELEEIANNTTDLINAFEKKYLRFIQEAQWSSEDYTDHDLYYIDSETTLHKSAQPKVSYTINVIELSQLEDYKDYVFDLGDITYVQDTDFFGWDTSKGFKTPHKEEIVITEMSTSFDNPEKSTIKVQNYRSAFEDLFQRLTASSQQLQFHSGEYGRAADVVDANGNIAPSCLEDAFSNNAYVLSNVSNQTVEMGELGIITKNAKNPAEIVRVTSGGVFLSDTGGEKWTTGITATGINAKTITTGTLNTGLVNIYNGAQKSFVWDSQGLNAYKPNENGGYSTTNFVRFNHEGLRAEEEGVETFSLTEGGLKLSKGVISINKDGNSVLIDPLLKNNGNVFEISVKNNKIIQIDSSGSANFQGIITAKAGGSIAGWEICENALTKGNPGESSTFCMYTDASGIGSIGGSKSVGGWNLTIGSNFGVRTNNNGESELWCNKVNITGDINASSLTIGKEQTAADKYIKNQITADHIATLGLEVGNQIKMGANATISWNNVSQKPNNLATTDDIQGLKTEIGENYVTTESLTALKINTNQINAGPLGTNITIAGLKIDNNSIYFGTWNGKEGTAPTVFMSTGSGYDNSYTICGQPRKDWVFGSGSAFGVTSSGKLYATGAEITGTINAQSGGTIGDWTIGSGVGVSGTGLKYAATQSSTVSYRESSSSRYQYYYTVEIKNFVMTYVGVSYDITISYSHMVDTTKEPVQFHDFTSLSSLLSYYGVSAAGTTQSKRIFWSRLGGL